MKHITISDYANKDYASYWTNKERRYLDEVEKYVIDRLLPLGGKWFLDLGCGFGRLKGLYLNRYENIVMLDYSESLLEQAIADTDDRSFPNVHFILADIYNLPFKDNSFEISLMTRVFHHLQEPELVIKQVRRILIQKGIMIFNFDNLRSLREIVKYWRKKSDINPFKVEHMNIGKDELLYYSHPLFVKNLLKNCEFDILKEMGIGFFYGRLFLNAYNPAALEKKFSRIMGKYFLSMLIMLKAVLLSEEQSKSVPIGKSAQLQDLLICPDCKGPTLNRKKHKLICLNCERSYPIKGKIYDLRIH